MKNVVEDERAGCFILNCVVSVCIMCPFPMVPWVGLQFVMVAFSSHTFVKS